MKTEFIENDSPATKPKRAFFTDDDKKFLLNYFDRLFRIPKFIKILKLDKRNSVFKSFLGF